MRIAIVNLYYKPDVSPTANLAASLAEHRAALGDEVTVITSAARYAGEQLATGSEHGRENPRLLRTPAPRTKAQNILARAWQYIWFYLGAAWQLLWLPRQDVIVALTTPPYIAAVCELHRWRQRKRTRVVLWNMDCYPDILEASRLIRPNGAIARCLRFINRRLFRRLDHVVCLDEAMIARLRRDAPQSLPMTVVPNWEPVATFPGTTNVPRWTELDRLGLGGRFIVLYFGNAGYGHEFSTVLDAAERLRDEPIAFLFVGGGSKHREIQAAAAARGLTNVVLHGYVSDQERPAVMASADLSLITLADEALGVMCPSKLHGNLAMGLPVIYVGPVGSNVDDAIRRFECGVSIRHGDTAQLVDFIRQAMHSDEYLAELKHRARHAFLTAYCDAQTLPQFDRVIDSMSATQDAS